MKIDYELAALILGIFAVFITGFFSIISLNLGKEWGTHVKALYLLIYVIFILIIIIFIALIGRKNKNGIK